MELAYINHFLNLWGRYFPGAGLPVTYYYTSRPGQAELVRPPEGWRCLVCELARVRHGASLAFSSESIGCGGGRRYTGFSQSLRKNFEYFLSCGIPGELEGERYKKSPELVAEMLQRQPAFTAPGSYLIFKRWDSLEEADEPAAVVFFAPPDIIAALFTLANYAEPDLQAVIAPFGSGCSSLIQYPMAELSSPRPRAVLGMFDISARPYIPPDVLTLAVPWPKFVCMLEDMESSFLSTNEWNKLRTRVQRR